MSTHGPKTAKIGQFLRASEAREVPIVRAVTSFKYIYISEREPKFGSLIETKINIC